MSYFTYIHFFKKGKKSDAPKHNCFLSKHIYTIQQTAEHWYETENTKGEATIVSSCTLNWRTVVRNICPYYMQSQAYSLLFVSKAELYTSNFSAAYLTNE